jgi:hypothetical protein
MRTTSGAYYQRTTDVLCVSLSQRSNVAISKSCEGIWGILHYYKPNAQLGAVTLETFCRIALRLIRE